MASNDTRLEHAEADPEIGVIVDAPHAEAPLVIAFAFVDWQAPARFDFARRLRKLEHEEGRPLNLILVRDTANLWYQHGVTGLGQGVQATAAALQRLIAPLRPSAIGTVGQSMGAYAAILFGVLLHADATLAFGPLSYLRSEWARRDKDLRWLGVMECLERHPPPDLFDDLPALLGASASLPSLEIVFGTGPERDGSQNHDLIHADRFAACPGVRVATIPEAGHAVVEWLIEQGRVDDILRRQLLDPFERREAGLALPAGLNANGQVPLKSWDDGWRAWIAENLALGASQDAVMDTLVERGFHPGEARREIYKAARSPYHITMARLIERARLCGSGPPNR